jgi:four helix bundle protein
MYKSFKDMDIWKKTMKIAEKIFEITNSLPRKEDYGYTSQIRRAALSISANIAEAFGRHYPLDKIKFYYVSRGSLTETESHLVYGKNVGYIIESDFDLLNSKLEKIHKDINKVIVSLSNIEKNKKNNNEKYPKS